jgi:tetratricopeptide (TPR) repeat protein
VDALIVSTVEGDVVAKADGLLELAELAMATARTARRWWGLGRRKVAREEGLAGAAASEALELYRSFALQSRLREFQDCWTRATDHLSGAPTMTVASWLSEQRPGLLPRLLADAARIRVMSSGLAGGFANARRDLELIIRLAELRSDQDEVRQARFTLADLYARHGRPFLSIRVCEDLLSDCTDASARTGVCRRLSQSLSEVGDWDRADEYHRQAEVAVNQDPNFHRRNCHSRGRLMMDQKRWAEAVEEFKESAKLAEESGDRLGLAFDLHHIGLSLHRAQRFTEAETWYKRALEIELRLPRVFSRDSGFASDENLIAGTMSSLGMLYVRMERYDESLPLLVEGYHRYQRTGSKDKTKNGPWLGRVEHHLGTDEFNRRVAQIEIALETKLGMDLR